MHIAVDAFLGICSVVGIQRALRVYFLFILRFIILQYYCQSLQDPTKDVYFRDQILNFTWTILDGSEVVASFGAYNSS